MIMRVLGLLWIVTGAVAVLRPRSALRWLERKGIRRVGRVACGLGLFLSGSLISYGLQHQGVAARVLLILGVAGVVKSFTLLKSGVTRILVAWSLKLPAWLLRIVGVGYIAVGGYLVHTAK